MPDAPDPRDPLQIVGANSFDRGMWLGQQHERMRNDKIKAALSLVAALVCGGLYYYEIHMQYSAIGCLCMFGSAILHLARSQKYELIFELKKNS